MICSKCGNEIESGAVFCGNCGQPVQAAAAVPGVAPVPPVSPAASPAAQPMPAQQAPAQPVPGAFNAASPVGLQPVQPIAGAGVSPVAAPAAPVVNPVMAPAAAGMPGPAYGGIENFSRPGGGKAIASLVLGIVGLIAWLVPIAGLIVGVLAQVFGSMSTKSGHRKFAVTGITLGSITIALSLLMFTYGVQQLSKHKDGSTTSNAIPAPGGSSDSSATIPVSTPCFDAKASITMASGANSCSVQGTDTGGETQFIKALVSQSISSDAALPSVAKQDVANVLTVIPGGYIDSQAAAQFVGSAAYTFHIKSSQDSGDATITYVRHPGPLEYNVYIIGRFVNSGDSSISGIESSWTWK